MSLVNYNQPLLNSSESRIFKKEYIKDIVKPTAKGAMVAFALITIGVTYDYLNSQTKSLDNSIQVYESTSGDFFKNSYVLTILSLLFGLGVFGVFSHLRKGKINEEDAPTNCKKDELYVYFEQKVNEENRIPEEPKGPMLHPPQEIWKHVFSYLKIKNLGIVAQISKNWGTFAKYFIITDYMNKHPSKAKSKLKKSASSTYKIKEYFGKQADNITQLPSKLFFQKSDFSVFPNLEKCTLTVSKKLKQLSDYKTVQLSYTQQLSSKIRDLKLDTITNGYNIKLKGLTTLQSLILNDYDTINYRYAVKKIKIELINLPDLKKIRIDGYKVENLYFEECAPEQICIDSKIDNSNINSLSSLKDLVIEHHEINVSTINNPSIERVSLSPCYLLSVLPNYPKLNTLALHVSKKCMLGNLINIDSLKQKYENLVKIILLPQSRDEAFKVRDYVKELKSEFFEKGIELKEINIFFGIYPVQGSGEYFPDPIEKECIPNFKKYVKENGYCNV